MKRNLLGIAAAALSFSVSYFWNQPAKAEGYRYAGYGWLATNDALADGKDRWETASGSLSFTFRNGSDELESTYPTSPFQIIELRFSSRIASPYWLGATHYYDRPLGATQGIGLHTHFKKSLFDISVGGDVVLVGEQTGLLGLQNWFHEIRDDTIAPQFLWDNQIENDLRLSGRLEVGAPIAPGPMMTIRPFVEFAAGVENILRAGLDIVIGKYGQDAIMARDEVTGHRYAVTQQRQNGFSVIAGLDYAWVDKSVFFPDEVRDNINKERIRYRVGASFTHGRHEFFAGSTWLSREIKSANQAQQLGTFGYTFRF